MSHDVYESPLAGRYASPYMLHLFSPDMRFQTWRRLWTALARQFIFFFHYILFLLNSW